MEYTDSEELSKAVATLKKGGIILYPTDTIWGLGCDATDHDAVKRLFNLKHRPSSKSMISLVDSFESLGKWVIDIPLAAEKEMLKSQKPLTVIFDTPRGISPLLLAEDGSAAFRIPANPVTKELCRQLGNPVVSTSANLSGRPSPAYEFEIEEEIISGSDFFLHEGEEFQGRVPSRIIKVTKDNKITVIRE